MTTRTFPVSEAVRRAPYDFPRRAAKGRRERLPFPIRAGLPACIDKALGEPGHHRRYGRDLHFPGTPHNAKGIVLSDLVIAFDIDMEAIIARKGFVIGEQGKPPDFVLEVGSETTGPARRGDETGRLRRPGRLRILAFRSIRGTVSSESVNAGCGAGRRPAGEWPL